MVKIGKYKYEKSTAKNKKLMTVVDGKKINFGDSRYGHYKDRTGIWKSLDHGDTKRRENYRKRHGNIKLKDGSLAINNPSSPAYHSYRIFWT